MSNYTGLQRYVRTHKFFNSKSNPQYDYEKLNYVKAPNIETIREYQKQQIQNKSDLILKKNINKYNNLNKMILSGDINTIKGYEQGEDLTFENALKKIFDPLNEAQGEAYYISNTKGTSYLWDDLSDKLLLLCQTIEDVTKTLQFNNVVSDAELEQMFGLFKNLDFNDAYQVANYMNKLKGDILENFGVQWSKKVGLDAVRTAKIVVSGAKQKEWNGQLIQDIMFLSKSKAELMKDVLIQYKDSTGMHEIPLQDFLDKLDKNSGEETLTISDNTYRLLEDLSTLNVQAKAGKRQMLWNINDRSSVAIRQYEEDDWGKMGFSSLSAKHTLFLLQTIAADDPHQFVQTQGTIINRLANYGLATVLWKVLNLNMTRYGNQFMLTPKGFVSYAERFSDLLDQSSKFYASIQGGVSISADMLDVKRDIKIANLKTR